MARLVGPTKGVVFQGQVVVMREKEVQTTSMSSTSVPFGLVRLKSYSWNWYHLPYLSWRQPSPRKRRPTNLALYANKCYFCVPVCVDEWMWNENNYILFAYIYDYLALKSHTVLLKYIWPFDKHYVYVHLTSLYVRPDDTQVSKKGLLFVIIFKCCNSCNHVYHRQKQFHWIASCIGIGIYYMNAPSAIKDPLNWTQITIEIFYILRSLLTQFYKVRLLKNHQIKKNLF